MEFPCLCGCSRCTEYRDKLITLLKCTYHICYSGQILYAFFTGDVLVLDEVSRFNEMIMAAAKPILLTTGGQIWICSTPFGRQGFFYESYLNKHERFKVIHVNAKDVIHNRKISEVWTEQRRQEAIEFLKAEERDMTALEFGQEYMAQFVEDLRQLFPDELIQKCMTIDPKIPQKVLGNRFLGVDVAAMGEDETVLVTLKQSFDKKHLNMIDLSVMKKMLLPKTVDLIKTMDLRYDYSKIYIDSTGVGAGVFQPLLLDGQTKRKVVSIENMQRSIEHSKELGKKPRGRRLLKEDLYMNLLRLMEQNAIALFNSPEIFLSLKSIQYEYSEGRIKIWGKDSHIAESLIRAAWCTMEKHLNIWVG